MSWCGAVGSKVCPDDVSHVRMCSALCGECCMLRQLTCNVCDITLSRMCAIDV
jgi:hypothetical protein